VDPDATRQHVEEVAERVRAIAPADLREPLLRAVAVHEERDPDRLPADVAPVVLGFGDVWKLADEADVTAYADRHAEHLRALLLFELAHEGAATEPMRLAAAHAGLAGEFAAWERALR
jgi:hypothetical protein